MACQDLKYEIALSQFPKFGPRRMKQLMSFFPSAEAAFVSGPKGIIAAGIEETVATEFISFRTGINPEALLDRLEKEGIQCLTREDPAYPALLKEIYSAPALLYCRGSIGALGNQAAVAIVGTRKCTAYGQRAAEEIAAGLARQKVAIISGLALGIDTIAHQSCLTAGGTTVAVIGTGLDRRSIYPSQNRCLADRISAEGGAVITEFPLGTPPLKQHFPQRNRLIAGLSLGTLVVEAGERSGALITAHFALDQDRDIFAVPGSIYSPASVGPNRLIRQGAKPALGAADIMEALDLKQAVQYSECKKTLPANPNETAIIACLSHEPVHVNAIIRHCGLEAGTVSAALTIMEMKGMIRNVGRMMYVLVN